MLNRLDEVSDEMVKTLGEIERDTLRVATSYNKRVKKSHFRSETLFGRQFCLLRLEATSSRSGRQIGKDSIESRK
jgi:tRNA U54 and U55 pseudouridine synthase Pus10